MISKSRRCRHRPFDFPLPHRRAGCIVEWSVDCLEKISSWASVVQCLVKRYSLWHIATLQKPSSCTHTTAALYSSIIPHSAAASHQIYISHFLHRLGLGMAPLFTKYCAVCSIVNERANESKVFIQRLSYVARMLVPGLWQWSKMTLKRTCWQLCTPCFRKKQPSWFFIISLPNCGQSL